MKLLSISRRIAAWFSIGLVLVIAATIGAEMPQPPTSVQDTASIPVSTQAVPPESAPASLSIQPLTTTPTSAPMTMPSTPMEGAPTEQDQIVETEVEETVEENVPGQPGKKVRKKRRRKVRRRIKRKGKKAARGKRGALRGYPARAKHPSQMTAQERFQRRSRILKGQTQRRMQRLGVGGKKPMSNLAKAQAMQLKRQAAGRKPAKGSRPTQGLTSKRTGKQATAKDGKMRAVATKKNSDSQPEASEQETPGDAPTEGATE